MKKFLFFLIFVILAAGAVLYFGWVKIPEGDSGVFFSTLTGYDEGLLETGKYHFRWQKLIPGTSRLYLVNTKPRNTVLELSGSLPSADVYSQSMPGNPDFSYSAVISLTYTVESSFILKTVTESVTSPENMDEVFDMEGIFELTEEQIKSLFKNYIESAYTDEKTQITVTADTEKGILSKQELGALILESVGNIKIADISVTESRLPEKSLYLSARNNYDQISSGKKKELLEAELRSARFESELEKRLDLLEKYGQLLTKYPILLEYLKINPEGDILREAGKTAEGR